MISFSIKQQSKQIMIKVKFNNTQTHQANGCYVASVKLLNWTSQSWQCIWECRYFWKFNSAVKIIVLLIRMIIPNIYSQYFHGQNFQTRVLYLIKYLAINAVLRVKQNRGLIQIFQHVIKNLVIQKFVCSAITHSVYEREGVMYSPITFTEKGPSNTATLFENPILTSTSSKSTWYLSTLLKWFLNASVPSFSYSDFTCTFQ